jgi:hypothetical protein
MTSHNPGLKTVTCWTSFHVVTHYADASIIACLLKTKGLRKIRAVWRRLCWLGNQVIRRDVTVLFLLKMQTSWCSYYSDWAILLTMIVRPIFCKYFLSVLYRTEIISHWNHVEYAPPPPAVSTCYLVVQVIGLSPEAGIAQLVQWLGCGMQGCGVGVGKNVPTPTSV